MRILYVEPFEAGSHASFTRALGAALPAQWTRVTLPGRHWKWRMRGSAVHAVLERGAELTAEHDVVLASSYVPLAELVGLCPSLAAIPRVLYFHENQLAYPRRDEEAPGERDHHYGFTQLVSALAANRCVFNSDYNRQSFLSAGADLLRRMPDHVPRGWIERIAARSEVIGVPLALPDVAPDPDSPTAQERAAGPILLWNHRWEHDKHPEAFFGALRRLVAREVPFRVAICGERYRTCPAIFEEARRWLEHRVVHFGHVPDVNAYRRLLCTAHIAVSTACHEFFGVAMLEATHCGAWPLVPDRLVYPELFPSQYRYRDDEELAATLESLCRRWGAGELELRADRRVLTRSFRASSIARAFVRCFASAGVAAAKLVEDGD